MEFKDQVIELLVSFCQEDVLKEDLDMNLFDSGLIDSFGTVELLIQIEERFGISIPITEFDRDTWNTPNNIAKQLAEFK